MTKVGLFTLFLHPTVQENDSFKKILFQNKTVTETIDYKNGPILEKKDVKWQWFKIGYLLTVFCFKTLSNLN